MLKVLAGLTAALAVSSLVTLAVASRLTRSAVEAQSTQITASDLGVVVQAYAGSVQSLTAELHTLAAQINNDGLLAPERRADLVEELGADARNLQLDVLQVVSTPDAVMLPAVGGDLGALPAPGPEASQVGSDRIVRTSTGRLVEVISVAIGSGPGPSSVLVGGYEYADALAYRLRNQLGTLGSVLVVSGGRLVGSTLPSPPNTPPAPRRSASLPRVPVTVRIGGTDMLVAYTPAGPRLDGQDAALGVALPDPAAGLARSLGHGRLVAVGGLVILVLALGWLLFGALTRPLGRLADTARLVTEGDLAASFEVKGRDEIASLAADLERMRRELLSQAQRLAESSRRVVSVQDDERRRLARDLHDGIQQQLVALAVKLRRIAEAPPAEVGEDLCALAGEAEDSVFALQDLGRGIYPSVLADQGLEAALRVQAGRAPMRISFGVPAEAVGLRFSREGEAALYFVGLEALANAQKHAPKADVRIALSRGPGGVVLEVADNGPGFDPVRQLDGAGLRNMADRMRALGGVMELQTSPGEGTRIRAQVPFGSPPDAASS